MVDRSHAPQLNGSYLVVPDFTYGTATNFLATYCRNATYTKLPLLTQPSPASSMTTLLARTNPSRPDYVPLTLLQDLVDIPRMLKDVGRLITTPKRKLLNLKEVGNQHLGFQFGWKPLFQDVKDLLDLQSHIHRRLLELQRLNNLGGLKRRIRLGVWGDAATNLRTLESLEVFWTATESVDSQSIRWGTVRWLPNVPLPPSTSRDAELNRQARKVVLGLSLESTLKGAWDLIPWSWLIDWFSNVGDFALQFSNTIPATSHDACIMTHTETQFRYKTLSIDRSLSPTDGYVTHSLKERYVGPGSLDVHLPFIGLDRLSILGALFVQRFKH